MEMEYDSLNCLTSRKKVLMGNPQRSGQITHTTTGEILFPKKTVGNFYTAMSMMPQTVLHMYGTGKKRRFNYYEVNSTRMELPLVVCDTKQQQEYLTDVLGEVMTTYRLRKQMYAILQAYLKELSRYEFSEKTVRHMAAFCCNLYSKDREYKEDLEDVLFECHNSAARQVMQLLKNI